MPHLEDDGLHNIPVTTLGISENTIQLLSRVGIETVGDCLDFHRIGGDAMITVPFGLITAFDNEVRPKLLEYGYLSDNDLT